MKERIIETSGRLFMRYGVKSITMDDIAKELGISKKTIYQHFSDKDEIVFQVAVHQLEEDKCEFQNMNDASKNVVEKMVKTIEMLKKSFCEINPTMLYDIKKYHPRAWNLFMEHKQNFILTQMIRDLEKGISDGLFRPEIKVEIIAKIHLESIFIAFDMQVFPPDRFSFIEVQIALIDHFIRGVLSDEGLKLYKNYLNLLS